MNTENASLPKVSSATATVPVPTTATTPVTASAAPAGGEHLPPAGGVAARAITRGTAAAPTGPASPATPRSVDWENPRVAAILAAAASCFGRSGFSTTTLADIGKELGLRKSIVHYYFASKAALVREVQSYANYRFLGKLREALGVVPQGAAPPRASSDDVLSSLWSVHHDDATSSGLHVEVWGAARREPDLRELAAALQHETEALVAETLGSLPGVAGLDEEQRSELAALAVATVYGLTISEQLTGDTERSRHLLGVFRKLLTPR